MARARAMPMPSSSAAMVSASAVLTFTGPETAASGASRPASNAVIHGVFLVIALFLRLRFRGRRLCARLPEDHAAPARRQQAVILAEARRLGGQTGDLALAQQRIEADLLGRALGLPRLAARTLPEQLHAGETAFLAAVARRAPRQQSEPFTDPRQGLAARRAARGRQFLAGNEGRQRRLRENVVLHAIVDGRPAQVVQDGAVGDGVAVVGIAPDQRLDLLLQFAGPAGACQEI